MKSCLYLVLPSKSLSYLRATAVVEFCASFFSFVIKNEANDWEFELIWLSIHDFPCRQQCKILQHAHIATRGLSIGARCAKEGIPLGFALLSECISKGPPTALHNSAGNLIQSSLSNIGE